MSPGTSLFSFDRQEARSSFDRNQVRDRSGVAWAAVVAVLFAAVAAISFAVDQSVTLSNLPAAPPARTAGR